MRFEPLITGKEETPSRLPLAVLSGTPDSLELLGLPPRWPAPPGGVPGGQVASLKPSLSVRKPCTGKSKGSNDHRKGHEPTSGRWDAGAHFGPTPLCSSIRGNSFELHLR